jgi:hypothetical protein
MSMLRAMPVPSLVVGGIGRADRDPNDIADTERRAGGFGRSRRLRPG